LGIKRGWTYYAEQYPAVAPFDFTKELRKGALWRFLTVWLGGRFMTIMLLNQADSDVSLAILVLLSLSVVTAAAMIIGLRFGWRSADDAATSNALANTTT